MIRSLLPLLAATAFATIPAWADDGSEPYQAAPCSFFCKVWRNVSGHVTVAMPSAVLDGAQDATHEPTPEEEARKPDVNKLVVVHGDIIKKSAAERASAKSAIALQEKRLDAMRNDQVSASLKPQSPSHSR